MAKKTDILDLYFMDARWKLLDIAAFLDRLDRADGDEDYRADALRQALNIVCESKSSDRAKTVLESLSDHSTEPAETASIQFANGAQNPDIS